MYPTTILHTTILLLLYIDYNIDYNIDYKYPICSGTSACSSSPCQDGICVPVSETERVCMCERNVTPDEQGSCGESPYM